MKKLIIVAVVVSLCILIVAPTFTQNPYTELYQTLATSDGVVTEGIISELEDYFVENPEKFLKEFKKQNDSLQSLVSMNFAYIAIGEDDYAKNMRKAILSVQDNQDAVEIAAAYQKVIEESAKNLPE